MNISIRTLHVYRSVQVQFSIMLFVYCGRKLNYAHLDRIRAVVSVTIDSELQISVRHNNFIILNFNTVCYMFWPYFDNLEGTYIYIYIYMHYLKPTGTLVKNIFCILIIKPTKKLKTKLRGLSPHANYTDRAAAAGRRNECQLLRIEGCHVVSATGPHSR